MYHFLFSSNPGPIIVWPCQWLANWLTDPLTHLRPHGDLNDLFPADQDTIKHWCTCMLKYMQNAQNVKCKMQIVQILPNLPKPAYQKKVYERKLSIKQILPNQSYQTKPTKLNQHGSVSTDFHYWITIFWPHIPHTLSLHCEECLCDVK